MNNANCDTHCEEHKTRHCGGTGLVLIVVLYILLAIILSSFTAC